MSMISQIVADHHAVRDNTAALIMKLDLGLHTAGVAVRMLRDMALRGTPGSGSVEPDVEELAAHAEGLLAFLGTLGPVIDALEAANKRATMAPVI